MSRHNEYGGARRGDPGLAWEMLLSPDGVTDDELAEILDYDIDGESAVLWCRRQDARKFKREKCAQAGALVLSVPGEHGEKPRYREISTIRPDDMPRLRRRTVRSLARQVNVLIEIELNDKARLGFNTIEDDVLTVVREVLSAAMADRRMNSA